MRYENFIKIIEEIKPEKIMEIGVCHGEGAEMMIKEALKHRDDVKYYGFDLFEDITQEHIQKEDRNPENFGIPQSEAKIQKKLGGLGAKIYLFKGDTKEILPKTKLPKMDLIFIDGGHSLETIESDWNNCKKLMHKKTVVIFDDYWNREDLGCKPLIDGLKGSKKYNVEILEPRDESREEWGIMTIKLVKVTRK